MRVEQDALPAVEARGHHRPQLRGCTGHHLRACGRHQEGAGERIGVAIEVGDAEQGRRIPAGAERQLPVLGHHRSAEDEVAGQTVPGRAYAVTVERRAGSHFADTDYCGIARVVAGDQVAHVGIGDRAGLEQRHRMRDREVGTQRDRREVLGIIEIALHHALPVRHAAIDREHPIGRCIGM